jgi:hypothetical protein
MIVKAFEASNPVLKRYPKFYLVSAYDGADEVYLTARGSRNYMSPIIEEAIRFLSLKTAKERAEEMSKNCPRLKKFEALEAHEVKL